MCLGPYETRAYVYMYVCRIAVTGSIPRCKQASLSDFTSTRLFDAFKSLILIGSRGAVVFAVRLQRVIDSFNHKMFKHYQSCMKNRESYCLRN